MGEQAWTALPDPVRARLAELASAALVELPAGDVPSALRRLAHFTPSKRARVGARQLVGELRDSPAFRGAVLAWWMNHRPEELASPDADQVGVAAGALLADEPDVDERLKMIAERVDLGVLRAERDAALARVEKLGGELERLRAELADSRAGARDQHTERDQELTKLRQRFRQQGTELRAARDEAASMRVELAELRRTGAEQLASALAERDRARDKAAADRTQAERARDQASGARQAAREARRSDEVRLALLVETLDGALTGLRRELALDTTGARPADLVAGSATPRPGPSWVPDAAVLDRLLGLPMAHLIVDGYNVSKSAYPDLTLFDQRARLVGALGVLAARTGAEVTVVFDGASVAAGTGRQPRGVRVLFSDPGVLADDVIRDLVRAEPQGRPLVVASSDRAVADSVRRAGAYPLAAAVLLRLLSRG